MLDAVLETSARLLRLLSLLQSRRDWTGPELAERLEVSARTVRRDVDRLRAPRLSGRTPPAGAAGGYRLGAGAALPPLLLDDDEAVAVAVGLQHGGAGRRRRDRGDVAARAGQARAGPARRGCAAASTPCTPTRCRSRDRPGPTVDPSVLTMLAAACRDREGSAVRRTGAATGLSASAPSSRTASSTGAAAGTWWPGIVGRDDWRSFRVDRIQPPLTTSPASRRASCRAATPPPSSRDRSPPSGIASRRR